MFRLYAVTSNAYRVGPRRHPAECVLSLGRSSQPLVRAHWQRNPRSGRLQLAWLCAAEVRSESTAEPSRLQPHVRSSRGGRPLANSRTTTGPRQTRSDPLRVPATRIMSHAAVHYVATRHLNANGHSQRGETTRGHPTVRPAARQGCSHAEPRIMPARSVSRIQRRTARPASACRSPVSAGGGRTIASVSRSGSTGSPDHIVHISHVAAAASCSV